MTGPNTSAMPPELEGITRVELKAMVKTQEAKKREQFAEFKRIRQHKQSLTIQSLVWSR